MAYTALYRKYRPSNFVEVVEQKHITTSLTNQIKNNQISHAYLFCGTRGTGKTSIARIFAKAINCEHPHNGNPCYECATCKIMSDPNNMDIIEIDAASNNRVEEIRDLRERVKYPPVNGRFKVYIIDEVHMLTDSAFNALLKTLEEPPEYVVFILGTTEVQKLPATILSRCLRFDFKLISNESLENHIKNIFKDSEIKYEDEAVSLIAKLGQGSVRDALSIADMCVAYTNRNVTYGSVVEAVGTTDNAVLNALSKSIIEKDSAKVLDEINSIAKSGKNLSQLSKDLVGYFRDIAVVKTCKNYNEILKYPANIIEQLEALAKIADANEVLNVMSTLGSLEQAFRYTQSPRSLFEITVLGLTSTDMSEEIKKLEKRVTELERQLASRGDRALNLNRQPEILVEPKLNYFDEKEIWGKFLIQLRNSNEYQLYAMSDKIKHGLEGNLLSLSADESEYKILINHKESIESILKGIDKRIKLNITEVEKKKSFNLVEFLKSEFGNKLEIIEGDK